MKYVGPRLMLLALWLALAAGGVAWAGGQGSDATTKGSVLEDDWGDDDDAGPGGKKPPPKKPEQKPAEQKPAAVKPAEQKPAGPRSALDEEDEGGSQVFDDDDDMQSSSQGKGGKGGKAGEAGPKVAGARSIGPSAGGPEAQDGKGGDGAEQQMQLKMKYRGVAPGQVELPPNVPKRPASGQGPQQMTWPGFQVKNGQATVFFQLSGPVEYSVGEEAGAVTLTLHDTVVSTKNNLHPLLVEEFKTPVKSVRIDSQRKKKLVRVSVMVKGQVAHRERLEQNENGYSMLLMEVMPLQQAEGTAQAQRK